MTRVRILCCGVKTLGKFFHSTLALLQFTQLYKWLPGYRQWLLCVLAAFAYGVWVNSSVREVKGKNALNDPEDWILRYVRTCLLMLTDVGVKSPKHNKHDTHIRDTTPQPLSHTSPLATRPRRTSSSYKWRRVCRRGSRWASGPSSWRHGSASAASHWAGAGARWWAGGVGGGTGRGTLISLGVACWSYYSYDVGRTLLATIVRLFGRANACWRKRCLTFLPSVQLLLSFV